MRLDDLTLEADKTLIAINEVRATGHLRVPLRYHRKKDGSVFPLESSVNTLVMDGRTLICSINRDISERLQAEAELEQHRRHLEELVEQRTASLQQANIQLLALSRVKDEFVSNISHELRTPLTNLMFRAHLLKQQPEALAEHLGVIERETDRLHRMIEDLLQLSRLDQDQIDFMLQPLNLNPLIQRYLADRAPLAEAKNLSLTFIESSNLPGVLGDPGLLEQALGVLLTNAMNYTPPGGSITVNDLSAGFSVSDSGPGIAAEEQPKLFERFFRGATGRKSRFNGTGLGLALAKEIIDRHRGKIEVTSRGIAGEGTNFTVWLLAADVQVAI